MTRLIPDDVAQDIPTLYGQDNTKDPVVYLRLFAPDAPATWWITEYSKRDKIAYGVCSILGTSDAEFAYLEIDELENALGPHGMHVERDYAFKPTPLSEVAKSQGLQLAI